LVAQPPRALGYASLVAMRNIELIRIARLSLNCSGRRCCWRRRSLYRPTRL